MKSLNRDERTAAIISFSGMYGLGLIIVIIVVYFLFNTPAGVFKNSIRAYKSNEAEQEQLLGKVEVMTGNLRNILSTDEKYLNSSNDYEKGGLVTSLQEYQKNISDALVNLKNDSAMFASSISKKASFNYITVFNSVVAYRNTITSLQKTIEARGGDASELLKMKSQLDLCNQQLDICKMLAAKPVQAPASGGGGGGGGNLAKEADLQKLLDKSQADLLACQKAKQGTVPAVVAESSPVNMESRNAQLLFDTGQDLYAAAEKTKNLIERRGMLVAVRQILLKSSPGYPDKEKLNKSMLQVENELRKLSNMG